MPFSIFEGKMPGWTSAADARLKLVICCSPRFKFFSFRDRCFSNRVLKKDKPPHFSCSLDVKAKAWRALKLQQNVQFAKLTPCNLRAGVLRCWSVKRCPTITRVAAATQCSYCRSTCAWRTYVEQKNNTCTFLVRIQFFCGAMRYSKAKKTNCQNNVKQAIKN